MEKILIVLGSTAVGKSDLAVDLALQFNGEVISADSRQVYRGLDIGTGKITEEEMRGVPHHLLDVVDPSEHYTAAEWKEDAEKAASEIIHRGKLPIICGGTGFYIQAIVDNVSFPDVPPNDELRAKLKSKTPSELFELLKEKDPARAEAIDKDNPQRLIRAIEVAEKLGAVPPVKTQPIFNALQIGLTLPREELRERIRVRLERRLEEGMIEEVESLLESGVTLSRLDELGLEYRYISRFVTSELSLEEMKEKLFTEISRYAKRQETWFKRDERIRWFGPDQKDKIFAEVERFLA